MHNIQLLIGTALVLAALTSIAARPAMAFTGNLAVANSSINQGSTDLITLTLDQMGLVGKLRVMEPDGDICVANGGVVNQNHPLSRTYPTNFHIKVANGDGKCDTNKVGEYDVLTVVLTKATNQTDADSVCDNSNKVHNNNHFDCQVLKAKFDTTFFVLPESPLGTVGLIGSSLAALGVFLYKKKPF